MNIDGIEQSMDRILSNTIFIVIIVIIVENNIFYYMYAIIETLILS